MKLRSLFLASLAAMAMVSCSNEENAIDNGAELAKNATMQLAIAFPKTTTTKATADEIGEAYEQTINDVTIIVVNGSTIDRQYFTSDQLVAGIEDTTKKNMTPTFPASAGTVSVYAYVNYGENVINAGNYTSYIENATYANLSINNNIANVEGANFHMNGFTTNVNIAEGVTNYAKVEISRVAAKITEATVKEGYAYPFEEDKYGSQLTITLTDYSLVNLGNSVNVLNDNASSITADNSYNYYDGSTNNDCVDRFADLDQAAINVANKTSYCLANQSSNTTTQVIYKAVATFTGGVTDTDGTFYIRNNNAGEPTVYSLEQIKEAFPIIYQNFDENTSIKAWSDLGVKKYAKGVCYYKKAINTTIGGTTVAQILRNNYYLLNVVSINDLGSPEIDMPTPDPTTLLEVEVIVKNWAFNQNDITLG